MKITSKNEIYLELALIINKEMYEDKYIPYQIFKLTEEDILKRIKDRG